MYNYFSSLIVKFIRYKNITKTMHVEIKANELKDKFYININLQILTNNQLYMGISIMMVQLYLLEA